MIAYMKEKQTSIENMNRDSEIGVMIIEENGNIIEKNIKAENMFWGLQNATNINSLFSTEYLSNIMKMKNIAKLGKIPESDFSFNNSLVGPVILQLKIKKIQVNESNCFLLMFEDVNLSVKKRKMVLDSYLSKLPCLESTEVLLIKSYQSHQNFNFNDLVYILSYIYCQCEISCLTQRVTGEIEINLIQFDIKNEVISIIQQVWSACHLKNLTIYLQFNYESLYVEGDKIKHHLIIKGILKYIIQVALPSTEVCVKVCRIVSFI